MLTYSVAILRSPMSLTSGTAPLSGNSYQKYSNDSKCTNHCTSNTAPKTYKN